MSGGDIIDPPPPAALDPEPEVAAPAPDTSIGALFARLIDDAERFVRAEINLYRAQFVARLDDAKAVILLGAIAFLLAQSALIALLVGLLVILLKPLGAVGATAVVVGTALIVVAILIRIAIVKLKTITEIKDGPP